MNWLYKLIRRLKRRRRSYSEVILADKPVAYWPLDETSGEIVYDHSGNGHHLKIEVEPERRA